MLVDSVTALSFTWCFVTDIHSGIVIVAFILVAIIARKCMPPIPVLF